MCHFLTTVWLFCFPSHTSFFVSLSLSFSHLAPLHPLSNAHSLSLTLTLREGCMGRGRPLCLFWILTMVRLHPLSHCMSAHGMCVPPAAPVNSLHGLTWVLYLKCVCVWQPKWQWSLVFGLFSCSHYWWKLSEWFCPTCAACVAHSHYCVLYCILYYKSIHSGAFKWCSVLFVHRQEHLMSCLEWLIPTFVCSLLTEKLIVCITRRQPPPTYCPCWIDNAHWGTTTLPIRRNSILFQSLFCPPYLFQSIFSRFLCYIPPLHLTDKQTWAIKETTRKTDVALHSLWTTGRDTMTTLCSARPWISKC